MHTERGCPLCLKLLCFLSVYVQYLLQTIIEHKAVLYAACWDLHFKRRGEGLFLVWGEGSRC